MNEPSPEDIPAAQVTPLLPEQRRFLTRNLPGEHHWNQVALLKAPPELTAQHVREAVRAVVNLHDGLRLCLLGNERGPAGFQGLPLDELPVETFDLRDRDAAAAEEAITRECTRIQGSMRMHQSPLVRLAYFTLADDERRVLLVVHHFVCDGLSFGIVLADLERACRALLVSRPVSLVPPNTTSADYARWLTERAAEPQLREQLPLWLDLGRPAEPVPLDRDKENTMATTDTVAARLSRADTARLMDEVLPGTGLGMVDVFLTAAIPTLQGEGGRRGVRSNLIGHGRRGLPGQPNVSRTVSWLSTRYPVSVEVDTSESFAAQLRTVSGRLAGIPMDGAGYGILAHLGDEATREALAAQGEPDITVNYLGKTSGGSAAKMLPRAAEDPGPDETETGLREHVHGIDVEITDGELQVVWYYSTNQFDRATVEGYASELLHRVRGGLLR
ncbi:FHA domain-containing protein [Streptomyces sp. NBRC 110611]|uniref:condensation domain-containing protein n=1 Tax=Streptomyces sp. NBRC 110611 TaxID=1621259 RepID=UPI000835ED0F|nr:condensation domain-containing protein [Streptomyces sp. NBRC 110611]GAU67169.1 FHA domain-containing protein [Streptomyces sp. NBRC 110611]